MPPARSTSKWETSNCRTKLVSARTGAGNPRQRVDILPIWRHQFTLASGVEPDGDIDAYSGATPTHSFSVGRYLEEDPEGFYLSVEVNAPFDANEFYHPNQSEDSECFTFPGIGQPSV